ncbi:MAG: hypothetical protein FK733_07030 [Asgard group archaeon]|nr:hypothetical protein [Asgard group archaeon]
MFDKIRRKATRAVKRAVGDKVEDEAEKQVKKTISKHEDEVKKHTFRGMVSDEKTIKGEMITDFDKFKSNWEKDAKDPAQSVFYLLMAAYNYCSKDKKIGEAMATVVLSKKHNNDAPGSLSGLKFGKTNKYLFDQMLEDENIAKSYLGADYEEEYKFNENKLKMQFMGVVPETDKNVKAIIQSSGKDFPTPVTLAKNKHGQWKVTEFSSIATGCKTIASIEEDF